MEPSCTTAGAQLSVLGNVKKKNSTYKMVDDKYYIIYRATVGEI